MAHVDIADAVVYRASTGRRYLTEKYAYLASARALIKAKHWTYDGGGYYGPECFPGIDLEEDYEDLLTKRLARFLLFRDNRGQS